MTRHRIHKVVVSWNGDMFGILDRLPEIFETIPAPSTDAFPIFSRLHGSNDVSEALGIKVLHPRAGETDLRQLCHGQTQNLPTLPLPRPEKSVEKPLSSDKQVFRDFDGFYFWSTLSVCDLSGLQWFLVVLKRSLLQGTPSLNKSLQCTRSIKKVCILLDTQPFKQSARFPKAKPFPAKPLHQAHHLRKRLNLCSAVGHWGAFLLWVQ